MRHVTQAYFLPVFKKLKATSKKTQANFLQKTQSQLFAENSMSWRQLMMLRKKLKEFSKVLYKTPAF